MHACMPGEEEHACLGRRVIELPDHISSDAILFFSLFHFQSKPFSILPGSGMAIEITQKVVDKVRMPYMCAATCHTFSFPPPQALLLGAILNRDQVFDAILEQGFLLDLPWGQDRKQALQNDPPTSAAAEDEGLDAKLNESSF